MVAKHAFVVAAMWALGSLTSYAKHEENGERTRPPVLRELATLTKSALSYQDFMRLEILRQKKAQLRESILPYESLRYFSPAAMGYYELVQGCEAELKRIPAELAKDLREALRGASEKAAAQEGGDQLAKDLEPYLRACEAKNCSPKEGARLIGEIDAFLCARGAPN